jgi:hypothetical protein
MLFIRDDGRRQEIPRLVSFTDKYVHRPLCLSTFTFIKYYRVEPWSCWSGKTMRQETTYFKQVSHIISKRASFRDDGKERTRNAMVGPKIITKF